MAMLAAPIVAWAGDPPHPTNSCASCHITHSAFGTALNSVEGNANLCMSCHVGGGTASALAMANADQAVTWPGLPAGVPGAGTSHRWDSSLAGRVAYVGGAAVASSGTVRSAGVFTGAYAMAFALSITTNGQAGSARFSWSATSPGGGGTNILTGSNVVLAAGLSVTFVNHTNPAALSFRSGDVWLLYARSDLSMPTNALLVTGMLGSVVCSICHDEHSQAHAPFDPAAPAYGGAGTGAGRHYLQYANDQEQMCVECHRPRAVTNAAFGSHPVGLAARTGTFYRVATNLPVSAGTGYLRCLTCHQMHRSATGDGTLLRMTNGAALCVACHTLADMATPAGHFNATSSASLWPGGQYGSLFPAKSNLAERGSCSACHFPHGWPDAANPTNHYPLLLVEREESLCYTCHDTNGPARADIRTPFQKAARHPVSLAGLHRADEGEATNAFGTANRHAECEDCHNAHQARRGYASPVASLTLLGVSRVVVTNGAAGTKPGYGFVPGSDTNAPAEYQVCFKCHSGWTTLPAAAKDLSVVFNPNNESFHPVEAAGRNTSSYMIASLTNGTGLPRLSVTSLITCADCHNSEQIPLTVSLASAYTGLVARGPHGSVSNVNMSGAILRGNYKLTSSGNYSATNFALCYICHSPTPFATTSENTRNDTRFNWHGRHMADFGAACTDCHNNMHGTKLALYAVNTNYTRLVSFGPAVTGQRLWTTNATGGSCNLTCHNENHNPERYP